MKQGVCRIMPKCKIPGGTRPVTFSLSNKVADEIERLPRGHRSTIVEEILVANLPCFGMDPEQAYTLQCQYIQVRTEAAVKRAVAKALLDMRGRTVSELETMLETGE